MLQCVEKDHPVTGERSVDEKEVGDRRNRVGDDQAGVDLAAGRQPAEIEEEDQDQDDANPEHGKGNAHQRADP